MRKNVLSVLLGITYILFLNKKFILRAVKVMCMSSILRLFGAIIDLIGKLFGIKECSVSIWNRTPRELPINWTYYTYTLSVRVDKEERWSCSVRIDQVFVKINEEFYEMEKKGSIWEYRHYDPCLGEFDYAFRVRYRTRSIFSFNWSSKGLNSHPYHSSAIHYGRNEVYTPEILLYGTPESLPRTTFRMTNLVESELIIENVYTSDGDVYFGSNDSSQFRLENLPAFPVTLACGEILAFDISFSSSVQTSAYLVIETSRLGIPRTFEIEMSGKIFII